MKKLIYTLVLVLILNSAFLIQNCEAQWVQMGNGMGTNIPTLYMESLNNNVFVSTIGNKSTNIVYFTANYGNLWTNTNWSLPGDNDVHSLAVLGSNLYAGTSGGGGVFVSTNNGAHWTPTALINQDVLTLYVSGNTIYAGTWWNSGQFGVFKSNNGGSSWTYCGLGSEDQSVYSFLKVNNYLFAGTDNDGIHLSTNDGLSWTHKGLDNQDVHSLAAIGSNIFAGTDSNGVYISTNYGTSWTKTSLGNVFGFSLAVSGNNLIASTGGSVFLSSNNGTTWVNKGQGFPAGVIPLRLFIKDNYIFVSTYGQSVWRRLLSEVISVQNISTEIPSSYSLSQNYPNPFNPTTKIRFDIQSVSSPHVLGGDLVQLIVYDALGREVQTLVNESLKPGTYEATFDASNLTSGIYFYRLETNNIQITKKCILLK